MFSKITANVSGLGEVGELEVRMFNKPQMFIEVQIFNLALMPPFCQTPVGGSAIFLTPHLPVRRQDFLF